MKHNSRSDLKSGSQGDQLFPRRRLESTAITPAGTSFPRRQQTGKLSILILTLLMLLGSWVATKLPTRDSAIDLPFLLPGKVEQEIEMRIGSVKVNQVRTTSKIQFEKDISTTPGIWLVVDIEFIPKIKSHYLPQPSLKDSKGRTFGGKQAILVPCTSSQPGLITACTMVLELPKDALEGSSLYITSDSKNTIETPDDLAVIDLGIDESRAARMTMETERITIEAARLKGKP